MTRRERLEARIEKRRQWSESRKKKSDQHYEAASKLTENIPFGQPILIGHHSEKAHRAVIDRSASHMDKSCESAAMAKHHESKADGLEQQLETSVFSDDHDAIEQLQARIEEREALRDRMKAINAAHKKFLKNPASLDSAPLSEADKNTVRTYKPAYSWEPHPIPPYRLSNLGATIRSDKQRIEEIKRRTARAEQAAASGGVLIAPSSEGWCRVTFAEKPDRSVLNALKEAGFFWHGGSWSGKLDSIPQCVRDLAGNT